MHTVAFRSNVDALSTSKRPRVPPVHLCKPLTTLAILVTGNGTEEIVRALKPTVEESKIHTPFCDGVMHKVCLCMLQMCG